MMKIAMAAVIGAAIAVGMVACSSSSDSGNANPQNCASGSGTGSGQTNAACNSCVQSKCSTEYNACFTGGGGCVAWVNAGCKGLPDQGCQDCASKVGACEQTNCASECNQTTQDSGTNPDFGTVPETGTPTTPNCIALETCCNDASMPASTKPSCEYLAGLNNDANCTSALNGFKGAGYCH